MPLHTPSEKKKNFIKAAIKRKGALTAKAKAVGGISKKGTIKKSFITKAAKESGRTGRQARLAITLSKLRKKK